MQTFDIEYKGFLNKPEFIKPAILIMILWRWVGYQHDDYAGRPPKHPL